MWVKSGMRGGGRVWMGVDAFGNVCVCVSEMCVCVIKYVYLCENYVREGVLVSTSSLPPFLPPLPLPLSE